MGAELWNGLHYGDRIMLIIEGVAYKAHYRRPHSGSPTDTFWCSYINTRGSVSHREEFIRNEGYTWCRGYDAASANAMLAALALEFGFQDEDARE